MNKATELNIRDDAYAELKEIAEQDGISINGLCDLIIANYIYQHNKETDPSLNEKVDLKEWAEEDTEFFALLHRGALNKKRKEKSKKKGNTIRIAKPVTRIATKDVFAE